ncbi:MAG TPA: hypothetical protein VFK73_05260, partial [Paludibacter sp.]|nr:hypothetical protein [Paludibacter sp.]
FWKSKPQTDSNNYYIDGSTWILEGHSKYGYQIKVLHSPNFSSLNYKRHKVQYSYAMIFKYIMKQTNIKEE